MSKPSTPDLIRQVASHALNAVEKLLPEWLPEGTRKGREWLARNTARGDRHAGSFGVSMDTGRWNDFADDAAHGGDLVSLLAYLRGYRQVEAAQEIDQRLALGLFDSSSLDVEQLQKRIQANDEARQLASQVELQRLQKKHGDAANQAAKLWQMAKSADRAHNYLQTKGLPPLQLRQLSQGRLLVPLCYEGRLVNLQIIDGAGVKRFLTGGRVQSCYSPLGKVSDGCRLYICEGWATGATLHIHTGSPVVCAMNAGNLKLVAVAMRERYGQSVELVIAGDDDRQTLGNPGRTAANRAANAANALVLFPEWPTNAPAELSDFNDLHLWRSQQKKNQP